MTGDILMDKGRENYNRFINGDNTGLVEIIREYKDGLIFYLNSFVNNVFTAENLAEDTFVKLAIKKPHNKVKATFKTWLYTIGRNVALDYLRKSKRRQSLQITNHVELTQNEKNLEILYIKKEQKIMIHKLLSELKPEYQQVLWLSYFENFSNKEIAKIMNKSVHSIETLGYRARQKLKTKLEKEGISNEGL